MTEVQQTLTVANLLADPVLADGSCLAGDAGLSREVTEVSWYAGHGLSESQGHLLLCEPRHYDTFYRLDALVRRAADAGVSALLAPFPNEPLPLSTTRLADRLSLPLLSVPDIHLPRLLHELTLRVRAPELARARLIDTLNRALRRASTGEGMLEVVAGALELPVSLLSAEGRHALGPDVTVPSDLRVDLGVDQVVEGDDGAVLVAHPLVPPRSTSTLAWLACQVRPDQMHRRLEIEAAFGLADPYLRGWLLTRRISAEQDANLRSQLLAEILTGREAVGRSTVERAASLGWSLQGWHVGIHVMRESASGVDRDGVSTEVRSALRTHVPEAMDPVDRDDGWQTWITSQGEPTQTEGKRIIRAIRSALGSLPQEWDLVAGIGRPHRGRGGLADTLIDATDAASLAKAQQYRPAVEHADEIGVTRLLAVWQRSEVLRSFAESIFAPLQEAGEKDLLTTLSTYLECGGSVTETARSLGLDRNTVALRLSRVHDRLGVDLDDPNQRLALQMACRTFVVRW